MVGGIGNIQIVSAVHGQCLGVQQAAHARGGGAGAVTICDGGTEADHGPDALSARGNDQRLGGGAVGYRELARAVTRPLRREEHIDRTYIAG